MYHLTARGTERAAQIARQLTHCKETVTKVNSKKRRENKSSCVLSDGAQYRTRGAECPAVNALQRKRNSKRKVKE
jgi:hypothetical protein